MSSCFFINHDNMIAFGRWLAEQRKTRFWSQSVLAEKLDVSQNSVSRWETGEAFPSPSHLQKIAELFGVTLDDILRIARQESLTEAEPAGYCIAETNAQPGPGRKTPEDRIRRLEAELSLLQTENTTLKETKHELEAEPGFARAEILTLKDSNRQLKAAMQQFIG